MGSISFINKKGSSTGGARLNVFAQEIEPEIKEGIWVKANKTINKIFKATIATNDKWDTKNTYPILPVNSNLSIATSIGTDVYIFGGYGLPTMAYKYNTVSKEYTKLKDLPYTNIREQGCVAIGTNIYFLYGASSSGTTSKVCKYDTITDTYTELGTVPHTAYMSTMVSIDNTIYIFSGNTTTTSAGKYKIENNTYNALASIPGNVYSLSAVTDGIYIYLFSDPYLGAGEKNAYKYDIKNNSYSEISNILTAVTDIKSAAINPILAGNTIYFFGYGANSYDVQTYKYDIATDTYSRIDDMLYGASGGRSVKVNNSIYLIGGSTSNGNPGYENNYKNVQVLNLGEELPEGIVDGSVIITNGNTYSTELISTDNIEGRVTSTFSDVIYYDNGAQDNSLPTYYGTGAAWVKFKN